MDHITKERNRNKKWNETTKLTNSWMPSISSYHPRSLTNPHLFWWFSLVRPLRVRGKMTWCLCRSHCLVFQYVIVGNGYDRMAGSDFTYFVNFNCCGGIFSSRFQYICLWKPSINKAENEERYCTWACSTAFTANLIQLYIHNSKNMRCRGKGKRTY